VFGYFSRRIAALLPVMFIVATVVFFLVHLIPGDPASVLLGPNATPADVERLRTQMGLDKPIYHQFVIWFGRAMRGDLGRSIFLDRPVTQAVLERAEPTLLLVGLSLAVAILIGIPAGILSAIRPNRWLDKTLMFFAILGVSIPTFWLGLNFIEVFAVLLNWLPAAGYLPLSAGAWKSLRYMILPALSLGFNQSALIARICRSAMLEIMQQDYIRTARSKGLTERFVLLKHALRNVLIPTVTVVGSSFAVLIGGAVVTEIVFNIPGVGMLIISSVLRRDYPMIQGCVLIIAAVYVLINLVVDILYTYIDPRVKYT
jgi:peptide/nickel transport system permease protein